VSDLLDVPDELKARPAAPAARVAEPLPATGEVAPGVHVANLSGFNVMFVEFRGCDLVVAPGNREAALETLERPHTLAPDDRTGRSADAPVETVADRFVITDGARRLEIWNVVKNPHTDENLFAWLSEERIVFQGDLFYFQEGRAFPPSGRGRMNGLFARRLRDRGIEPRAVYGVHNNGAAPRRDSEIHSSFDRRRVNRPASDRPGVCGYFALARSTTTSQLKRTNRWSSLSRSRSWSLWAPKPFGPSSTSSAGPMP
jgi:hypothetical protein